MRAALVRDDDYATLGKPPCDWDDRPAREALVDALVRDCQAALAVLHGQALAGPVARRPGCSPWSPAKTSKQARTGCFGSPGRWPGIG